LFPAGKRSGWRSLDDLDVRFNAGELAVLGARTGHGKTSALVSLLLNWLRPLAQAPGNEVLVLYSAEEPELRIYHRLLAMLTATGNHGWTVSQIRDFLRDPTRAAVTTRGLTHCC
jgi:replicative DNA helicase